MIIQWNKDIQEEIARAEVCASDIALCMGISEKALAEYLEIPMSNKVKDDVRRAIAKLIRDRQAV